MHARLQEMLEFANDEIARAGYQQRLPAGVVLTGGGALVPGVVELGREVFAMPVRIGVPGQGLTGLTDSVELTDRLRSGFHEAARTSNRPVDELVQERAKNSYTGRVGDPAEFGDACAFLCSAKIGFIVGHNLILDGGAFNSSIA